MTVLYEHIDEDLDGFEIREIETGKIIISGEACLPTGRELTKLIDVLTGIRGGAGTCSTCGAELQGRDDSPGSGASGT